MEPDGALLQLYPRAQYPRLRGLRCLHGKGIPIALTRPYGRFKLHPAPSGNVLDKSAGLAPDQTLRPQPRRMTSTTCPASSGNLEIPGSRFVRPGMTAKQVATLRLTHFNDKSAR